MQVMVRPVEYSFLLPLWFLVFHVLGVLLSVTSDVMVVHKYLYEGVCW